MDGIIYVELCVNSWRIKVEQDQSRTGLTAQDKLLEAAFDIFGKHGYESATTRMIAGEAGVNIAAIPYYFGGKEGLYRAVISHIVSQIQSQAADILEKVAVTDLTGTNAADLARDLLDELLTRFINFILGSSQGQRISRIMMREQMYPSSVYDLIYKGFMYPILSTVAKLVSAITGVESNRRTMLQATAIIGQVLIFRISRETIVLALDLQGYDEGELQEIRDVILLHTHRILGEEG